MVSDRKVVFDATNKLVWVEGQRQTSKNGLGVYGRDAQRFATISQAKKYGNKLALKRKTEVYDKFSQRSYSPRSVQKKTSVTKKKPYPQFKYPFGYTRQNNWW